MAKRRTLLLLSGLTVGLAVGLVLIVCGALAQGPVSRGDSEVHDSVPAAHVERQELVSLPVGQVISHAVVLEPARLWIAESITAEARLPLARLIRPETLLAERYDAIQPVRPTFEALTGQPIEEACPLPQPVSSHSQASGHIRPAATCVVTSTADSGPGTLRRCLQNAGVGDTIIFDTAIFPPAGPATISLSSALPWIITDSLTVDASDAGVILDGSGLASGFGFVVTGTDGVKIQGLQIVHFPLDGVVVISGATNTTIGGDRFTGRGPLGQGNLISANGRHGVRLGDTGTMSNTVLGNLIGTNVPGTATLGNLGHGVVIRLGASNNIIGGTTPGTCNLISGNEIDGIRIENADTTGNQVIGNFIGTDYSGSVALGNLERGVTIVDGASHNIIGGDRTTGSGPLGQGNLISGNGYSGIWIDLEAMHNTVAGNYIGTNISGTAPLSHTMPGVVIMGGAKYNIIGGGTSETLNLISGNGSAGVWIQDLGTSKNQVLGNHIGTVISGVTSLGNQHGVVVIGKASDNTIGGDTSGARNLISGNRDTGVWLQDSGTSWNRVLGNYIGTNITGTMPLSNSGGGIFIGHGATNNVIGGNTQEVRNVISGNGGMGVHIQGTGTMSNAVLGNYIGVGYSGTISLSNFGCGVFVNAGASYNIIGGDEANTGNLISANEGDGIRIRDTGTDHNRVLGNFIGTNLSGTETLGNLGTGIVIHAGASDNIIGDVTSHHARNLISGNSGVGIAIWQADTSGNQVLGNYVGTNDSGTGPIPNRWGVGILDGPTNNTIGGYSPGARNLISGNTNAGVQIEGSGTADNSVLGNYIGTTNSGLDPVPNLYGVVIYDGASHNSIGGIISGARNIVSGNGEDGIVIFDASDNRVYGNYVGFDRAGASLLGNARNGISITWEAMNNVVGGDCPAAQNLIGGNGASGVHIQNAGTSRNHVLGNYIGKNAGYGVFISAGATHNTVGISNTIVYNTLAGVGISGTGTLYNTVTRNTIHDNGDLPIDLVAWPIPVLPPTFGGFSPLDNTVWGTTCSGCRVEIFANPTVTPAGTIFLDDALAGTTGAFSLTLTDLPPYRYLSATATDPNGTTSEFANSFRLFGSTITPASITVTVSSSATVVYTHTLTNIGPNTDTFILLGASSQGWLEAYQPSQVMLGSGTTTTIIVTITVPDGLQRRTVDRTVITSTSSELDPQMITTAEDITIFEFRVYLPLVIRNS